MNQRYGGKFSPGTPGSTGQGPARAAPPAGLGQPVRAGARRNLIFVAPFVLVFTAFRQDAPGMVADLVALGLLLLAAWLTREGIRAHEAYDARPAARRPAIPRKIFGSVLSAAGIGLAAWYPGAGLGAPLLLGLLGGGLHLVAFGPDPLNSKGAPGIDAFQSERAATMVAEAEKHLTAMRATARPVADRALMDRIDRFATTARGMFRSVENDPRDLTAVRKYMSIYLEGAEAATRRFAELYARNHDPSAREDFVALLDDLDTRFGQKTATLLANDRTRMDVEIEVLRERLAQDAPRTPDPNRD